jgi:hypothetical protein
MGKYSDDVSVESAVQAAEDDYNTARDQLNSTDPTSVAAYKQARDDYFNARRSSRGGRGMSLTAE